MFYRSTCQQRHRRAIEAAPRDSKSQRTTAEKRVQLRCVITKWELFTTYCRENPRLCCQPEPFDVVLLVFLARALGVRSILSNAMDYIILL